MQVRPTIGPVTMAVGRQRFMAWLLVTGFCLLGAMVPSATAAPKSVLILSEGPVLPYGLLLIDNIVVALHRDSPEPLNIYRGIDRPNPIRQRRIRAAARSPVQLQVRRCGGARPHHHDHRASARFRPASSRRAVSERAQYCSEPWTSARFAGALSTETSQGCSSHYDARKHDRGGAHRFIRARVRSSSLGGASRLDRGYARHSP